MFLISVFGSQTLTVKEKNELIFVLNVNWTSPEPYSLRATFGPCWNLKLLLKVWRTILVDELQELVEKIAFTWPLRSIYRHQTNPSICCLGPARWIDVLNYFKPFLIDFKLICLLIKINKIYRFTLFQIFFFFQFINRLGTNARWIITFVNLKGLFTRIFFNFIYFWTYLLQYGVSFALNVPSCTYLLYLELWDLWSSLDYWWHCLWLKLMILFDHLSSSIFINA